MSLVFNYKSKVNTLPGDAVEHLNDADELSLKLIFLLSSDSSLLANAESLKSEIAKELECTEDDVTKAISFWVECGVLAHNDKATEINTKISQIDKSSKPIYTGVEIADIVDSNDLRPIIDECAQILGVTFNTTDSGVITTLFHHLGVSEGYLLTLCSYCASINKKSLAYIQRLAYNLYDDGIDNLEKLESYLSAKLESESFENKISVIFGITGRALTSKEKKSFEKWHSYGYGEDIISKAYEITIEKTGKYTLSYLDKIVENWHDTGYTSLEQIDKAQDEYKKAKEEQSGSFDTNEFFELALKRSRESVVSDDTN